MRRLFWRRAGFLALSLCLILAAALVPTRAERQVLLCGEAHDEAQCKEQELALWRRSTPGTGTSFWSWGPPRRSF